MLNKKNTKMSKQLLNRKKNKNKIILCKKTNNLKLNSNNSNSNLFIKIPKNIINSIYNII